MRGVVKGFQFSAITAGIKAGGRPDLALICSEVPAIVVGAFTTNQVQAAPVTVSKRNIRSGWCSAIIINSGNANACTGARGLQDAEWMVKETSDRLHLPRQHVLVCSTGKIGEWIPRKSLHRGIPRLVKGLSPQGASSVARAILTTDRGPKISFFEGKIGKKKFHLLGIAKGAGMIFPRMKREATMLAFLMTDLRIGRPLLKSIFDRVLDQTFHCITVDGDTSTNDTVLLIANGMAAAPLAVRSGSKEALLFEKGLHQVMQELALKIVQDGEGATKRVQIDVLGARSWQEAQRVAETIAHSPLVKTSFFGEDPNWGRILAAVGRSKVRIDPDVVDIYYNNVCLVKRGLRRSVGAERRAHHVMKKNDFRVTIALHQGNARFSLWTSDLGTNYVKLNATYRT